MRALNELAAVYPKVLRSVRSSVRLSHTRNSKAVRFTAFQSTSTLITFRRKQKLYSVTKIHRQVGVKLSINQYRTAEIVLIVCRHFDLGAEVYIRTDFRLL